MTRPRQAQTADQLYHDIRSAIAEIRRLVYGLRPPSLDELGLVGAIREAASRQDPHEAVQFTVDAADPLGTLPAAVEVAAYRIAAEALTNVHRHARARHCTVRLRRGSALELEITDDGAGRVLIADDHPIFRHGVQAMLAAAADLTCVGEARTGQEIVDLATSLQPDVILMDLQMPDLNGIEATRRILAASPRIRVLMVTMFEDDASVFTAMKAGARGLSDCLRAVRQ